MITDNRFNQHVKILLISLLLVGLASWLYTQLDYDVVEKDTGYQGEALINDFLAAEYFLFGMGKKAEKIELFNPNRKQFQQYDSLLITNLRQAFDITRSKNILNWVDRGGHLIITAQVIGAIQNKFRDNILDELGILVYQIENQEKSKLSEKPVDVALNNIDVWQVDFNDNYTIETLDFFDSEIIWSIDNKDRIHGLQIKLGQGRLTILSDIDFLRNHNIQSYDHAAFLFSLSSIQSDRDSENVFYYSLHEKSISLFGWLWINAQSIFISLLLFIIFLLWMLIPRFGPIININQPVRREFLEHLSAAGHYHWHLKHSQRLLSDIRLQLSNQVQLKCPEWSAATRQNQIKYFSELSKLEPNVIESALFDSEIQQEKKFINTVIILEKLRKNL